MVKDVLPVILGSQLKNAILSGSNNISKYKKQINELNIFPVPDGDTGTNMSMTIGAAAEEMKMAEQKLLDTFSKTQEDLFDEYESAVCDVGTFEDTETFRYGVSVGVRFLLEALMLEKI